MTEASLCSKRSKTIAATTTTITDLPDEVLVHILSLLSTEDAVKTVLIRGFGDLWRSVPVLDFNSRGYGRWKHVNDGPLRMIPHVLDLHNSSIVPLDKLCIGLAFPLPDSNLTLHERIMLSAEPYPQEIIDCVKKSIIYAKSRKVKILDLNFDICCSKRIAPTDFYDLSEHHVLVSDHLTVLRLTACSIKPPRRRRVNLASLKVLYLNRVMLTSVPLARVLVGCPLLEDLSLVDCHCLRKLTCTNRNLSKVTISRASFESATIGLSCPYVLRLELVGVVPSFASLDVSSVVDVSINAGGEYDSYGIGDIGHYRDFWGFMQKTSHCKIFRAGGWALEELAACGRKFRDWPSFCYKSLVVEMGMRMENQPGITLLLQNSQSLETLTLHFHRKEYWNTGNGRTLRSSDRGEVYWKTSFPRLVTIHIYGEINNRYVLQLVRGLLRCAIKLKEVVISAKDINCPFGRQGGCQHYTSDQLRQLSHAYKEMPRASPEAVLYFNS